MKLGATIRFVLATALFVLFSGSAAFAHAGHEHGGPAYSAPQKTTVSHLSAPASAPLLTLDLKPSGFTIAPAPQYPDAPVLTASAATDHTSGCGPSCCCCNGPSSCGMAGSCAVHALSPADNLLAPALQDLSLGFPLSDLRSGRRAPGLDRPPNA